MRRRVTRVTRNAEGCYSVEVRAFITNHGKVISTVRPGIQLRKYGSTNEIRARKAIDCGGQVVADRGAKTCCDRRGRDAAVNNAFDAGFED